MDIEQRRAVAARRRAANVAAKLSEEKALQSALRVERFTADREAESDSEHGDLASIPWRAIEDARVAARSAGAAAALHAYINAQGKKPGAEEEAQEGSRLAELAPKSRWHVIAATAALGTLHGFKPAEQKPYARGRVISNGRVGKVLNHDLEYGVVLLEFANGLQQWYEEDEIKRYDVNGDFISTHDPGPWSWRPPEPYLGPNITIADLKGARIWGPRPTAESTPVHELRSLAAKFFQERGEQVLPLGVRLFHANRLLNPDNTLVEADLCDGAVLIAKTPSAQREAVEMVRQLTDKLVTHDVPKISPGAVGEKLFDIKRSLDVEWLTPDVEVCLYALFVEGKAVVDVSVEFSMNPHKIADLEGTKLGYWSDAPYIQPGIERRCYPGLMYLSIYETPANVIFYVVDLFGELALLAGEESVEGNYGAVWYAEADGDLYEVGTHFPLDFWDRAFRKRTPRFDLLPVKVAPTLLGFLENRAHGDFSSRFARAIHGRDDRLAGKKRLA